MGWYVGFKLHLLCNEKGEIINFVLTKANVDDRNESVMDTLTDKVFGKLYADKGYISQSLFGKLWDEPDIIYHRIINRDILFCLSRILQTSLSLPPASAKQSTSLAKSYRPVGNGKKLYSPCFSSFYLLLSFLPCSSYL